MKVLVTGGEACPAVLLASSERTHKLLGFKPQYPVIRQTVEAAWKWRSINPDGYKD